jgi:phosphatidylethanolamine/phosphatidyl-N-methylethanolamine N-methyltransferase
MQQARKRGTSRHDLDFFRLWLRRPAGIGAVLPSGMSLARAMAEGIDLAAPGVVVELGGGTGNVTRALLAAGVPREDLIVIEREPTLCVLIAERFPGIGVICADARDLSGLPAILDGRPVKCVVSGLPLLSIERSDCRRILQSAFDLLAPDGLFLQFTYTPVSPIARRTYRPLGLQAERVDWVFRNFPPATVWRYRRRAPGPGLPEAA